MAIKTHLVGSLPFQDAREAMEESLTRLGDTVLYLPDGETGERGNYIEHLVGRLAGNPALEQHETTISLGPTEMEGIEFSIRRGATLQIALGDLGYARDWEASLPLFRELRVGSGRDDLRYLMAVATPLSIAMPYFHKPFDMLKAIRPLSDALRAEIAEAVCLGEDVLAVQFDAALDQIFVTQLYGSFPPLASLASRWLARGIAAVAKGIPPGVPVGVHLCLGNPQNQRVVTPRTSDSIVWMANAVERAWPAGRPLDYVHLPIVDSTDLRYYDPLKDLLLAPSTRVIAGMVYEDGHAANRDRFDLAKENLGYAPDIACACGMGRRTPAVARALLDEMRRLADESAREDN